MMSEKKDIRFGVALAFSLGGVVYSFLRSRKIKNSQSPPSSDFGNENHRLQTKGVSCSSSIGQQKYEEFSPPNGPNESCTSDFSPTSIVNRGEDVEENSNRCRCDKKGGIDGEQELERLMNMVKILKDREKSLEIQLFEYYGLKEQETAVVELQNRLKLNSVESKLFSLKIGALEADKRRLEAQVEDQAKLAGELEAAKLKIRILNKKLRSEAEQNRENIIALQERVKKVQEEENKTDAANYIDIQPEVQKLKDLEEEAEELRKTNSTLRLENSDLAQNLEYVQLIATSVMDDDEKTTLKKECDDLTKENEELTRRVEQLQADRCSDAEEMVYLRWINACLRYELRNYQPSPGRTIARELSKTLSPESEEKAKQLILQYGSAEEMTNGWLSSQNCNDTDSEEYSTTTRSTSRGSRYSLDLPRTSDERSLGPLRSVDSITEDPTISMQANKTDRASELVKKYAEALKVSHDRPLKRRPASIS